MPKLNKSFLDKVKFTDEGQAFYRDDDLRGFVLRVGTESKTFIVDSWLSPKSKVCRYTIGKFPHWTPEQARDEARRLLGLIAQGVDPNDEKASRRAKAITLAEVLEDYIASGRLKPDTEKNYRNTLNRCVHDWLPKAVTDISKDMIEKRHRKLSDANGPRGKGEAQANLTMRILRALFTFASNKYEDNSGKSIVMENPVRRLSQIKAWNRTTRRQSVIQRHELRAWFEAVKALENKTMSDYLLVCILTGLRRNEAAQLRWEYVDLEAGTITIPGDKTKNHQEHRLPLSDYLQEILQARFDDRKLGKPYVFPGSGNKGCLVESKRSVAKVGDTSGVQFMVHDLRRTFLTIAEGLDIPHYALKRLANHKNNADVTAGYIIADVERLREPMQAITKYVLDNVSQSADVDTVARTATIKKSSRAVKDHQPLRITSA